MRCRVATDRDRQEWASRGLTELRLIVLHAAPERPREGVIVCADGTDWAPDVNGPGVFAYLGAAWVRLG